MPASRSSRKGHKSHKRTYKNDDGFFRPGSFLSELTGGSHVHSRKSSKSRKSRRSKKSVSYKRGRKSRKEETFGEAMQTQKPYREFVSGNYNAARTIVMKAGETGRNLVTGTIKQIAKMWQIHKKNGSRKVSKSYSRSRSRKSRTSRRMTGNGAYRDFVKGNYRAAREVVMRTGKTGSALTQGTMKQVAKWWNMQKEGKPRKSHKKRAESYKHTAECKYSRRYGSRKSKGAVVCMCAVVHGKGKHSKKMQ